MIMTVQELKEKYPKRFDQEYWNWVEHELDYHWWDFIEGAFQEKCEAMGIKVDNIAFSGFYSQGDYAAFTGMVDLAQLMKHLKLDEDYPALTEAMKHDGSWMNISRGWGNNSMAFGTFTYLNGSSATGVFEGLDFEAWQDLINEEWKASDIEAVAEKFCLDLCNELFIDLRDEYEYLTSEESFIGYCDANDVVFADDEGEDE